MIAHRHSADDRVVDLRLVQCPQDIPDPLLLHKLPSPEEVAVFLRERQAGFHPIEPWQ